MNKPILRRALAAIIFLLPAGCASSPKPSKGTSAVVVGPSTASTDDLREDSCDTKADLADLESQAKRRK